MSCAAGGLAFTSFDLAISVNLRLQETLDKMVYTWEQSDEWFKLQSIWFHCWCSSGCPKLACHYSLCISAFCACFFEVGTPLAVSCWRQQSSKVSDQVLLPWPGCVTQTPLSPLLHASGSLGVWESGVLGCHCVCARVTVFFCFSQQSLLRLDNVLNVRPAPPMTEAKVSTPRSGCTRQFLAAHTQKMIAVTPGVQSVHERWRGEHHVRNRGRARERERERTDRQREREKEKIIIRRKAGTKKSKERERERSPPSVLQIDRAH